MSEPAPNTAVLKLVHPRLPGIMFALGLAAYGFAVTQRSSLGVAGVDAVERFHASATALSSLALLQVAVYALAQVPVGMLLDRFGPSRLIICGAFLMAIGQATVAVVPSIELAVLGRVLVGLGDATTFVSALRLVSAWFRPRRVPVMQQWLSNGGQIGQLLSAVPFAMLLHFSGWETAFLSVAALSVIIGVVCLAALRDTPMRRIDAHPVSLREALVKLGESAARPGTRLGFWSHFTIQFPGTVFALLWGYPLMVQGLGISTQLAPILLLVPVFAGMLLGPILGILTARFPLRRSNLVFGIGFAVALCWIVTLMWPNRPPMWMFLFTLVITGLGSTGSTIGFDFARTFNPGSSYGSASGIVNVGGFAASSLAFLLIGLLIDFHSGSARPTWESFQLAFLAIPGVIALGTIGLLTARNSTRLKMAAEEGVVVAPLWRVLVRKWRRQKQ